MIYSIAALFLLVVVFNSTNQIKADGNPYYFSISYRTYSDIQDYDTLRTDIDNTLNKYTKPKASDCRTSVAQQSYYKDGLTKTSDKIKEANGAIKKVDDDGKAESQKCGTSAESTSCYQKITKDVTRCNKLKDIKKPAIQFMKDTKRSTLESIQSYMKTCTK